jgi:ABC-type multidrug transport system fused ATPase/permease subunit
MTNRQKAMTAVFFLCIVLACVPMQHGVGPQLSDMLKVTLTVYAMARGLNAVISVAQGTEMSIEPMGVGLTLTPGEVLDPLNDLIEQFSLVLLLASASIGVQQIVLLLGDNWVIRLFMLMLAVSSLLAYLLPAVSPKAKLLLLRLVIVLTVLRLLIPGLALLSHQTQQWLQTERQAAVSVLASTQSSVDEFNSESQQQSSGWFSDLRDRLDIQARLEKVQQRAEQGVEAAVYLLAEFLLIMVLLPLLFAWLLLRLLSRLRL